MPSGSAGAAPAEIRGSSRIVSSLPRTLAGLGRAQQRDGLAGRALAAAREAEAVGARRSHRDPGDLACERAGDVGAHRVAIGRELRRLQHHERIDVDEAPAAAATRRQASASRSRLRAPRQRSSSEGNIVPMSSMQAAPSSASQSA